MAQPIGELSDQERLDRLRLIRSSRVGPIVFHQLMARCGSAAAALDALPGLARRGGGRPVRICPADKAEQEIAGLAEIGARLVARGEPDYPAPLAAIEDAPPLIAVKGNAALMRRPAIGVVGARNASAAGLRFTRQIAAELGRAGLTVVSGLARGIDAAAHAGSLETGTVAVLGGGIDVVYPGENAELYDRVAELGLLVAESPLGTQPQARHFPRRNRLISGLSLGVLVVEAALKSGSLITARLAGEQGREVFAVPGSPLDPRSRGANRLLRDGAVLTESAEDVLAAVARMIDDPLALSPIGASEPTPAATPEPDAPAPQAQRRLVAMLGPTPVHVDELVRETGLAARSVATLLLELELAGRIERHPGNRIARAPT